MNIPPEIWHYIITEHALLNIKYIDTIKMVPSKLCITETVVYPLLQHICNLFNPHDNIINKPHIFNKKNLFDIINHLTDNMSLDTFSIVSIHDIKYFHTIELKLNNKSVKINDNSILYLLNNRHHRLDGPAFTKWYKNGLKWYEEYYVNSRPHRIDGPGYTKWYENGLKCIEIYYIDDKLHCTDGPAYIRYDINGHILTEMYYINNRNQ